MKAFTKSLTVSYAETLTTKRVIGTLFHRGQESVFEYDPAFLQFPLPLSPFKLPIAGGLHKPIESSVFQGLYGVFADSLPDGWGLMLMKKAFVQKGISFFDTSPLDKLGWLGLRTMGALVYEPEWNAPETEAHCFKSTIDSLFDQTQKIISGPEEEIMQTLYRAGGSPGGARPKVIVGLSDKQPNSVFFADPNGEYPSHVEPWLIKFPADSDSLDAPLIEYIYSLVAQTLDLDMPDTKLFKMGPDRYAFGIKRFDRVWDKSRSEYARVHVHSLAGLLHSEFRYPALDYLDFLKTTILLTKNRACLLRAFRLMVFNVVFSNLDDHAKNFAFTMDAQGHWKLAPAYDLTRTKGIRGERMMSVLGEGKEIKDSHMLELAKQMDISAPEAHSMIARTRDAIKLLQKLSKDYGVSHTL